MIIGICGKSGCGKSTLAKEIVNIYGDKAIHLDIDKVGHSVLTIDEVKKELIENFGIDVINNTKVDRKKLGKLVFVSCKEMNKLSDITWKYMQIEIDKFLTENKDKIIVLDWILLTESKYFQMCDIKILLDIPYETRKIRAIKRDNISAEAFELREKASINYNILDFDYVINKNDKDKIRKLVKEL